ncbi:MAG: hypothetical protein ACI8PZ_001207 [Myxococcota bacterium]|jgi:hypothetical protein
MLHPLGAAMPFRFLSLLLLIACESGPEGDDKPPAEVCDNLEDDDLDELADCADPDCAAVCGEVCTNGTDDDLDGLTDCLDDDCDGLCPENCGDGRDNDADGAIDCDDRDCFGSCPEVCDDGFDNDGDGKVDCLDEECVDPACDEICTDGRDNDADALVDCADDDCNDPACAEVCSDGRDNDADGRVDCDDSDCDGDCPEICDDGRDNDADGRIDCDDAECEVVCDADGDGFFNADFGGDDCDDSRADINPSRPEVCNPEGPLDDDCDGLVDEDDPDIDVFTLMAYGPDNDGDGYGTNADVLFACTQPDGWGIANTDCDDRDPDVNPSMPEICNPDGPVDDDCDGLVDDADPDVSEDSYLEWFADRDADGFGSGVDFEYACSRPDGTSPTDDDCDDADPAVGPPTLWYPDGDGDGFGDGEPVDPTPTCDPPGPGLGAEWRGLDCDDGDPGVHPGAEEICEDLVDQDCDGDDAPCCGGLSGSYPAVREVRLVGGLPSTYMTVAWDGTFLLFGSGGSSSGIRLTRHRADGSFEGAYEPGIDIRSVFTLGDGEGPSYIRGYSSSIVYEETGPGVYTRSLELRGGLLDSQSAVVWDPERERFLAMEGGNVTLWDRGGALAGELVLSGYGRGGEDVYPQNRGIVATPGGCWLTYHDGVVSSWDELGVRIADGTLSGGPTAFDSYFSFSYADGLVWLFDPALPGWRGYDMEI